MARHKASTQDSDEETQSIKLMNVVCSAREERRDRANEEASCEGPSRSEAIASRSGHESDEQRSDKGDDVGVLDLDGRKSYVFGDDIVEQWWERIPE